MEETCYGRDILPWTLVFCFLWWGGVAGRDGETMLSMALCERYSDLLTRNMICNMHGDEKMFYSTFLNRYIWINHEYIYIYAYIRELSLFLHLYEYWTRGQFSRIDCRPPSFRLWTVSCIQVPHCRQYVATGKRRGVRKASCMARGVLEMLLWTGWFLWNWKSFG